jgi:hypothetical protein
LVKRRSRGGWTGAGSRKAGARSAGARSAGAREAPCQRTGARLGGWRVGTTRLIRRGALKRDGRCGFMSCCTVVHVSVRVVWVCACVFFNRVSVCIVLCHWCCAAVHSGVCVCVCRGA